MIAYAPVEAPTVALAVVVEDAADTGGLAAAPLVRRVLTAIFGAAPDLPPEDEDEPPHPPEAPEAGPPAAEEAA